MRGPERHGAITGGRSRVAARTCAHVCTLVTEHNPPRRRRRQREVLKPSLTRRQSRRHPPQKGSDSIMAARHPAA